MCKNTRSRVGQARRLGGSVPVRNPTNSGLKCFQMSNCRGGQD